MQRVAKSNADRAQRESKRAGEKAQREGDRAQKEADRRQQQIDLANHRYKDKRIPVGFARKMNDAAKKAAQAGIADVKDAEKAADRAVDFPFDGPEKVAFLDYLRERMPSSRLKINSDGSGWYLDGAGKLYHHPSDRDYVLGKKKRR